MKKLFTPGPWVSVQEKNTTGNFSIETYEGCTYFVAQTIGGIDKERANASLIAAAPDLLEALEFILPNIEALANEKFGSKFLETYKPVLKAREAIAKAYGKEVTND